jgi:hypothetical protein
MIREKRPIVKPICRAVLLSDGSSNFSQPMTQSQVSSKSKKFLLISTLKTYLPARRKCLSLSAGPRGIQYRQASIAHTTHSQLLKKLESTALSHSFRRLVLWGRRWSFLKYPWAITPFWTSMELKQLSMGEFEILRFLKNDYLLGDIYL